MRGPGSVRALARGLLQRADELQRGREEAVLLLLGAADLKPTSSARAAHLTRSFGPACSVISV